MRAPLAVALVVAVLAHAPAASPCGALFRSETDQNLALDAQRALYVLRSSTVELHLQMRAAGTDGAGFAWIIPVPGEPTLSLGDAALFDALDRMTTPTVEIVSGGGSGGGGFCAGDAAKAGGGDLRDNGVQHFGGGVLGDYTYDVVGGNDAAAIEAWLGEHGYRVPEGFAAALAPYAGRATFVAVRLSPGAEDEVDLEPLVVTVARPFDVTITYPLGLSRVSTVDVAPVVLWVLADKRYRVANFGSTDLQGVADAMRDAADGGEDASYAGTLARLTALANGRLVVTEFARDLSSETVSVEGAVRALVGADTSYLTRLYMEVPVEAMQDLVVTFAADAPEVAPFATAEGASRTPATAACVALAIVLLIARRRRAR